MNFMVTPSHVKKIHGNTMVNCTTVFWGGTIAPWYTMVQLITMVQMYHSKNHGTFYLGITTMVLHGRMYHGEMYHGIWGGTFAPWHIMVQLITMVQMYNPKHHGTIYHGKTMVVIPW
jgi:hypothetical protein